MTVEHEGAPGPTAEAQLTVCCEGLARCRVRVWCDGVEVGTAKPDREMSVPLQAGSRVVTLQLDAAREGYRFVVRPGDHITMHCLRGKGGKGWSLGEIASVGLSASAPWSVSVVHDIDLSADRGPVDPPERTGRYPSVAGILTEPEPPLPRLRKAVAVVCALWLAARMIIAPYQQLIPGPWFLDFATIVIPAAVFILCINPRVPRNLLRKLTRDR